jgi:hypothetical protein
MSTISDIVVAVAAIIVAVSGLYGLLQWKRELKGKQKFELARRIAINAFEFRDRFHFARSPLTFGSESADRPRAPDETREAASVSDEWFARGKRMEALRNTARLLHEASWEASILLDQDIPGLIQPLETSLRDLWVSFQTHFQSLLMNAKRPNAPALDADRLEEHYRRVYGMPDDDVAKAVDAAVENLVERVRDYVR